MRTTKINEEESGVEMLVHGDYEPFIPKLRYSEV
jgi:hypothetical protein